MSDFAKPSVGAITRRRLLSGVAAGCLAGAAWPSAFAETDRSIESKPGRISVGPVLSFPAPSDVALYLQV